MSTRIAILLVIMVLFSWTSMTYYMRTSTYREKERDYTAAALVLGASTPRIIFNHIIPNVVSTIVTFMPFTVVNAITAVTALDFLGWGLPPPTPSIGELLKQGSGQPDHRALDRFLRLRRSRFHPHSGHVHWRGRA